MAYYKIKDEGLLSKRRFAVYEAMCLYAPPESEGITANELFRKMETDAFLLNSNVVTRLGELRDRGVVEEVCDEQGVSILRTCSVSGHNVLVWRTLDALPIKIKKTARKSYRLLLEERDMYKGQAQEWEKKAMEYYSGLVKCMEMLKSERLKER
jgi:hypothetical protein